MSNENKTAVKEFVQRYINSHEPDTFARNENGLMMYQLKHSGINLESFFEDIIEDFISEQNELASLQTQEKDKEIAELKAECDKYEKQMIEDGIKIEQLKGQLWHSTDDFTNMYNKFQSTIESQQKEIEELRAELESEKSLHKISLQHQSKSNVKVHKLQSQLEGQEKAHQLELQIIGDRYQSKIEEIEMLKREMDFKLQNAKLVIDSLKKEIEELDKIKILYSTLVESYQEQSERIKDLEEFISVQVVNYTTSKLKAFEVKKLAISLLTPTKE